MPWSAPGPVGRLFSPDAMLFGGVLALSAACSAACTPARFEPAGDARSASAQDLLGNYAVRSTYQATSNGLHLTYQELLYARISDSGSGEFSMELHSCLWSNNFEGLFPLVRVEGSTIPERTLRVTVRDCASSGGCVWSSEASGPFTIGYQQREPARCVAGKAGRADVDSALQPWLADAGTCTCPISPDAQLAANQVDDCRIDDPDGNGAAGFTAQWSFAWQQGRALLAYQATSEYVQGSIAADGAHVAQERRSDAFTFLACDSALSCPDAPNASVCPARDSRVEFAPLDAVNEGDPEDVCRSILDARDELWGGEPKLDYPNDGC